MKDIGVVYYQINLSENRIDAIWYTSRLDAKAIGTGIALGDISNGFPGDYTITYFDPDGSITGPFKMKIVKKKDIYELSWFINNELLFYGVGIETPNGLAAGWRKYE